MSSNGGASQFSEQNCQDYGLGDIQLAKNVWTDLGQDPFVFECSKERYTGPSTIPACYSAYTTLCIGAHGQQHACVVGDNCHAIDWTATQASPCSSILVQYASVQAAGLNTPCCDSSFCTTADSTAPSQYNFLSQGEISCSDAEKQLYLCVNDGRSIECVNTSNQSICSANYTSSHSGTTPSKSSAFPGGYTFSIPTTQYSFTTLPTSSNSSNDNPVANATKTRTIIIAVVASVGGAAVLIALFWLLRRRQRHQNQVHQLVLGPPGITAGFDDPYAPKPPGLTYQGYGPVQTNDYYSPPPLTNTSLSQSEPSATVVDSNLTSVAGSLNQYTNLTVNHYHSPAS